MGLNRFAGLQPLESTKQYDLCFIITLMRMRLNDGLKGLKVHMQYRIAPVDL